MRHLLILLSTLALAVAAEGAHIRDVQVSPPFFNPTAGRSAQVRARVDAGTVTLTILDRDRFPIRKLAAQAVADGDVTFAWDGRDDRGEVVPDEAYNVLLEWRAKGGRSAVYDPSLDFHAIDEDPQPRMYSALNGVLSYRLSRPARVHIEAGQATLNRTSGRNEGPILRTIVDREPRVAGAVVEKWNGFDESGTIHIADLPHFVVSILATSLPDNSIITRGNRKETFVAYALRHRPASAAARAAQPPARHHMGLSALDDNTPALHVVPAGAARKGMDVTVSVDGPTAARFLAQPTQLSVWVDEHRVLTLERPPNKKRLSLPAASLPPGEHRVAVNWISGYGPAAVSAFRVTVPHAAVAASEVRR